MADINSNRLLWMINNLASRVITSFNGRSGDVKLTKADLDKTVAPTGQIIVGVNTGKITVSPIAPPNPALGDIWIDTSGIVIPPPPPLP